MISSHLRTLSTLVGHCVLITTAVTAAWWEEAYGQRRATPARSFDISAIGRDLGGAMSANPAGIKSFNRVAPNVWRQPLGDDLYPHDLLFESGNAVFTDAWVARGASTHSRVGLGPIFNARSCEGCHQQDGKGNAPENGLYPGGGLLIRLSSLDSPQHQPHEIYGNQLQDQSTGAAQPEARIFVTYKTITGNYPDGTSYSLREPHYEFRDTSHGPVAARQSPRLAPAMVGLGLLAALPESTLTQYADPDDQDRNGISGRLSRLPDGSLGRFGWKAGQPTLAAQNAGAFLGDMGITSQLQPRNNCPYGDDDCDGGPDAPWEATAKQLHRLELYTSLLAVPRRRNPDGEQIKAGARYFVQADCGACHRYGLTTGRSSAFPETQQQVIHPFTDLLLHDMGPGLADDRPLAHAAANEWRTAPLWGVGLVQEVNPKAGFLHDGRARSLEEAILWHDGEAAASRQSFMNLSKQQRLALLAFLKDL